MDKKPVFRGSEGARIDDKSRLKIPNLFRTGLDTYGPELFVTSVTGEFVCIYPLQVWEALEQRLAALPDDPVVINYIERVNYFGQEARIDAQGRVVIHSRVRDIAGMSGEVDVVGGIDHLKVWNADRQAALLAQKPFTDDDQRRMSQLGTIR